MLPSHTLPSQVTDLFFVTTIVSFWEYKWNHTVCNPYLWDLSKLVPLYYWVIFLCKAASHLFIHLHVDLHLAWDWCLMVNAGSALYETAKQCSRVVVPLQIPTSNILYERSVCPCPHQDLVLYFKSHSLSHAVVFHNFSLDFPQRWSICSSLCPLLNYIACSLLIVECWELFMYCRYKSCVSFVICKYFPPVGSLYFYFFNSVFCRAEVFNINDVQFINLKFNRLGFW